MPSGSVSSGPSLRRRAAVAVVAGLLGSIVATAPTAAAGSGATACDGPPVTMRLEGGDPPVGGPDFEVTDGVARRVPILTGRDGPGETPKELERLERQAAKTKLALYQIFLADFRIPRRSIAGEFSSAFYQPSPGTRETAATLVIVPTKKRGFEAGDVVSFGDEIRYDVVTTFGAVGLAIVTASGEHGVGTPSGRVEVLALDDRSICVDVDFEVTDDGAVVAALEGVVEVPVARSKNRSLYFF